MKFGRLTAKHDNRTLRLGRYLTSQVPTPPASCNLVERAKSALGLNCPDVLCPMLGNDRYGDCTIVAAANAIIQVRALTGQVFAPSDDDVVGLYLSLTGGADDGLAELDVLKAWRAKPFFGEPLTAFVSVDPRNLDHVRTAISLGGLYIGFRVQENCESDFTEGRPWIDGALTDDGHAVLAVGYSADGVIVRTWGDVQRATWAWWLKCVEEAHALVLPESPLALAIDGDLLQADLAAIGA